MMDKNTILAARNAISRWHDMTERDLPWRGERDPYRVWLSEIMLQQTRTEVVKRYYRVFLENFPDVRALADAPEEKVLKMWEGLGYYSRARNLHKAAKQVANDLGGVFPATAEGLKALPGIGVYTAGAIASAAYGERVPAIDANQIRVLTRLFAIQGATDKPETAEEIRRCAMELLDPDFPGRFNQALMGLGAMVCGKTPKCDACPVCAYCMAKAQNIEGSLPNLPEKAAKTRVQRGIAIVIDNDRVLVRQRPDKGLLAKLWVFPGFEDKQSPSAVAEELQNMGIGTEYIGKAPDYCHVFTHRIWDMQGFLYKANASGNHRFVTREELLKLAMPSAMREYREFALRLLTENS